MYDGARAHARCVPLVGKDEERERLAARAVDLLGQAIANGFNAAAILRVHPDFAPLRPRDDFKKLFAALAQKKAKARP
jgi:hypothetical protein